MDPIPLEEIRAARERIKDHVLRTPLIPLNFHIEGVQVYLKLENLQSTGSFKQRGAANALLSLPDEKTRNGVVCPSAGNFAQGLAYMAQKLHVSSTIIVPDTAPSTKIAAIRRYGGNIIKVPYGDWWKTMTQQKSDGVPGEFIHPVCNRHVIAGNGSIGLEILEDLPDVDVILVPFGGGGLITGIASAVKATKPDTTIVACEVSIAAPLTHARKVGHPEPVPNHQPSFVDGMGGKSVFQDMWGLISTLVDDTAVLELSEISDAVRILLERHHVLAEGAGAAPLAAALAGKYPCSTNESILKVVAVISGGNIDLDKVAVICQGAVPH